MKRSKYGVLTATALVIAMTGSVWAATATVSISANVTGTCQFDTVPTLAFGALDQTSSADATAGPANLIFWCTKNAAYTLSDPAPSSDGSHTASISNGTDAIPVAITYTNFSGTGSGKTGLITSVLAATILNADYVDVSAGAYSGSVVFTIAP